MLQLETGPRANRIIKVTELSQMLSISIIYSFDYYKVTPQSIPRVLTDEQKTLRSALKLQHLIFDLNNAKLLPEASLGVITSNRNSFLHS